MLEKFDSPYRFERPEERNLINWYKVLNRFDELLERYINDRSIFDKSSALDHGKNTSGLSATSLSPRPSSSTSLAAHLPNPLESHDQITVVIDSQSPKPNAPEGSVAASSSSNVFTPSQNLVLLILRLTHRLIRNSSHDTRHVYNSVEHVGALLSDNSTAIVLLTLEILNMLLQRSHKYRSARITMTLELTERLIDLSYGWGGRENGLGLLECCSATPALDLSEDGKKLFFQFTPSDAGKNDADEADLKSNAFGDSQGRRMLNAMSVARNILTSPLPLPPSTPFTSNSLGEIPNVKTDGKTKIIYMSDAGLFKGDERWLLTEFAQKHGVPKNKLFSFLCAFRRASRFSSGREARLEASIIRLYAITTLFQVQPLPNALHESINREPELIQDIVSLAKSDPADGLHDIPRCLRIISIRCITAMSSDRHRVSAIVAATGVDQYHGALPALLRSEMTALISSSNSTSIIFRESSESDGTTPDKGFHAHTVSSKLSPLSLLAECSRFPPSMLRIQTTEALLALVHGLALAPGTSGATPLANSGVLGILIPALTDRDPRHSRVVAQAIRTMQAIIEGSNHSVGCQLFRDQEGLALIAERIAVEVGVSPDNASEKDQALNDEAVEVEALRRRGESRALYHNFATRQMTHLEALEHQPPSSSAASRGLLSHSKWALLRGLHQLFIVSLGNGGSEVREAVANTPLPKALRKLLGQPFMHGGSLFFSAASLTTDIAHAEPTATKELVNAGVAQAVLRSISVGLPPCGEAVKCIPNLLAALCLAPAAREEIVSSAPLKPYLLRLATPFYTRAMHGEIPIHIGSSLDELMRHVEALRPEGNRAMCEYLLRSAAFVRSTTSVVRTSHPSSSGNSKPDVDVQKNDKRSKSGETGSAGPTSGGPQAEGEATHPDIVLLDKMKLAVANNSSRMAGIHQGSAEHQEGVVSSGGLDHMIGLRLAPALACPEASVRETHTFSRHYPTPAVTTTSMVTSLRNFSSRYGTVVLQSLFKAVLQDSAYALQVSKELNDCWLPEEEDVCVNLPSHDSQHPETPDPSCENSSLQKEKRKELRKKLEECIRKLRVEVLLLGGLSRGGPGSSSGVWESAGGSHVATIISTVERAARLHLAKVYTGLSLNSISEADLGTTRVTAAADPTLKPLRAHQVTRLVGDVSKIVASSRSKSRRFEEICKSYEVPPEDLSLLRRDVKGFAWHLATLVAAAQRLYSTLAKGLLIGSRRHSRASSRHNTNAKSLSSTIGRIFALHFKAAVPLWNVKVASMGGGKVAAAWDYIRGIIVEIKGTLFDEPRSSTHGLLLKSFLEAGGGEALIDSLRPSHLLKAASMDRLSSTSGLPSDMPTVEELKELLEKETLSTCSFVLAIADLIRETEGSMEGRISTSKVKSDDEMSSDSVSNQARAMSRMVVSDVETSKNEPLSSSETKLVELLKDKEYLTFVRDRTKKLSDVTMHVCTELTIQKIAADSWSTVGSFMYTLAMCSGLSNNSVAPEHRLPYGDWKPVDIHRTALHVALRLLEPVAKQSEHLLSVRSSNGTALTDVLGVIQVIASSYPELSRRSPDAEGDVGNMDDWEDFLEPQEETPSSRPRSPDPELVQSLVEMGFPERRARRALRRTPGALPLAADWLLSTPDDDDLSDRSDEEDRQWSGEGPSHANGGSRDENDNDDDDEEEDDEDDDIDGEQDDEDINEDDALNDDEEDLDDADNDDDDNDNDPDNNDEGDDGEGIEIDSSDELHALGETEMGNVVSLRELTMIDAIETDSSPINADDGGVSRREESSSAQEFQPSNRQSQSDSVTPEKISDPPSPVKTTFPVEPPMAVDVEGKALLHRTASVECTLLYFALVDDVKLDVNEVKELCAQAANYIGLSDVSIDGSSVDIRVQPATAIPVAVERFKTCKKAVFESLLKLTFNLIRDSSTKDIPSHVPYAAIEMLSALHKDGVVSKEHAAEFASSLSAGLRQWLTTSKLEANHNNSRGQFVPLWSHHGGWQARKLLESQGAFRIAYDFLREIVNNWKEPSEETADDASGPIEKLKISDNGSNMFGKEAGVLKIRAPSEQEAMKLSQITTCFLVLDAQIRYRRKDDLVQLSQKRFEEMSKDKFKKDSNMELDQVSNERPTNEINGGRANVRQEDTSPNIDDDRGISKTEEKSNFDVVMSSDENVCSLERENEEASRKKEKVLNETLSKVSELTESPDLNNNLNSNDSDLILMFTLRALRFLSRMESGDAMLAALQLLGGLTQEWHAASLAINDGIIDALLKLPHLEQRQVSSVDCRVVRMLVRTILRHVIEDRDTLTEAMVCEIREVASGSNRPPRSSYTLRSLIEATSPLAARDLKAYVNALHCCVSASGNDRGNQVVVTSQKGLSRKEAEDRLEKRSNVRNVIVGLCDLLAMSIETVSVQREAAKSEFRGREDGMFELSKYVLKMIAEIVEFSRVAAVALVKTNSPSKEVKGNALDYMLQKLLPLGRKVDGPVEFSEAEFAKDALDVCNGVQRLFLALCSKGAGAHTEAVDAFARAVGNEAKKEKSCSSVVKGVAQCLPPGTRSRVMRAVLKTNLANDLAICLGKLDVDGDVSVDVTITVLRALSLIGEAATHMARHGDHVGDDVSFGGRGGDTWMGFRDREDFLVI